MTPLCELARKYKTDKGGAHVEYPFETCHNYTPTYYDLFSEDRLYVQHVLEIGVAAGRSLRMWEEFFPNAKIVGLDIDRAFLFNEGRIKCFYADQSDADSLRHALAEAGPQLYDIIVDDGSHHVDHQQASMLALLPYLAVGGTYIIEDIGWYGSFSTGRVTAFEDLATLEDAIPPGFYGFSVPTSGGCGRSKDIIEPLLVVRHV